jgi:hypothetical protein
VTPDGAVIHRDSIVLQLQGAEIWVSLAPGATLEGDIEMKYLPFQELPRDHDLLLLWSHSVALNRGAEYVFVSGVSFLPNRSAKS